MSTETDEHGRRLVVRSGHHRPHTVVTAAGPVEVRAPRVDDRCVDGAAGERKRFSSKILEPWCRKSPKISEVPLLYLHGLSSGDFVPALEQFLGGAAGRSPAGVTRLTKQRSDDHAAFQDRDLSDRDYVYVWADDVHSKVCLGQARSCVLVLLGVRLDGTKELIALAEGLRESTESWADLLATVAVTACATPSRWSATAPWIFGGCSPRRSRRPAGRSSRRPSRRSLRIGTNCSRSTTFRPSTGSTCGPPTPSSRPSPCSSSLPMVTRGAGSPAAALARAFKLVESAQARRRAITGAHLVSLVRAGARCENGVLVEREEQAA